MLPQFLAGSYKRYKEETTVFTTWLAQAAQKCGYKTPKKAPPVATAPRSNPAPTPGAGRLKGKARKEAKRAEPVIPSAPPTPPTGPEHKYNVTTQDLLRQAEAVASSAKKVPIPTTILRVVERAVKARERCAKWFGEIGAEKEALERHQHFINILRQALEILKTACEAGVELSDIPVKPVVEAKPVEPVTADAELSNRYASLAVEDHEQEEADELLEANTELVEYTAGGKGKGSAGRDIYQLEFEGLDFLFDFFCFFEDLHCVEDFLEKTWQSYKDDDTDLAVAAMTTNAAIALVRHEEADLIEAYPSRFFDTKRSYESLSAMMIFANALAPGRDFDTETSPLRSMQIQPFDRFIYLPTARILSKYEKVGHLDSWPPPIPPVRMQYIFMQEMLEKPEIKGLEEEDRFLSQYLIDLRLWQDVKKNLSSRQGVDAPLDDEILKGLFRLKQEGEIKAATVFGARVLYLIHKILEKGGNAAIEAPYKQLLKKGREAEDLLGFQTKSHGECVPGGAAGAGERWSTPDVYQVVAVWQICNMWINIPILAKMKEALAPSKSNGLGGWFKDGLGKITGGKQRGGFQTFDEMDEETKEHFRQRAIESGESFHEPTPEMLEVVKEFGLDVFDPAPQADYLFSRNPVWCGTMLYEINTSLEKSGIALANHHSSIYLVAHLYNAVHQQGHLQPEERWVEMDHVLAAQQIPLFGGDPPKTPKECHTRMLLKLGFSARNFAHNKRKCGYNPNISSKLQKGKTGNPEFAPAPVTTAYQPLQKSTVGKPNPLRPDLQVWFHLAPLPPMNSLSARSNSNRKPLSLSTKASPNHVFTPLDYLTHLRSALTHSLPEIRIDYLTLVRTCNRILRHIRARMHLELGLIYKSAFPSSDSKDIGLLLLAMSIMKDSAEVQNFKEAFGLEDDPQGAPNMKIAAAVLQECIRSGGRLRKEPRDTSGLPGKEEGQCLDCLLEAPNHRGYERNYLNDLIGRSGSHAPGRNV